MEEAAAEDDAGDEAEAGDGDDADHGEEGGDDEEAHEDEAAEEAAELKMELDAGTQKVRGHCCMLGTELALTVTCLMAPGCCLGH